MINQITLVGRIVDDVVLKNVKESGVSVTKIRLAVQRNFKNAETLEYDTDYINCTLWAGIAEAASQYCKKGNVVGVRGRLQNNVFTYQDDKKFYYNDIICEKLTFISSNAEKALEKEEE